ncbi:MAG TPA: protein kinase [Sedimentisphaerales bacterium]|nr:protein kinase [Sedimentisphaerales bacterium]HRS11369.1 protein kinase [Sedimentisphaerales bacterium]HRV47941.1 protein kinase [Sedimentisphaerales bacterium]
MTPERKTEELFHQALELKDPEKRAAYLDEACAGDEELRAQVETLLRWDSEAGGFMDLPDRDPNDTRDATSMIADMTGMEIGRYKLLEKIGEGGMATVYMAEQRHPICRRVALKIIKLGMDTKQVIARFEAERQALALMDHPNIATVLDAGATETGRPYFVMELVRGLPITKFCDANNLTTRERLELFVSVCHAVQHAHQRGIIHRDIKPSNVLVTLYDGKPVPKVIDFGIAKALNQRLTEKTIFTRYSQMIGTPEYMSPEQAEMSGLDVDTRTDVFSLGVLLYELLTGKTPFDSQYLLSKGYGEMQRIIREEEPTRPSTKVSTLGEALIDIAKHRRVAPESLGRLMRGDLDWIVMKTLEKDRTRRYETVHSLAEDVERHLRNEPIMASSPGMLYRVQKFLRRNRTKLVTWSAAAVIVIGLLLVGGAYIRFRTERTRSDHLRTIALVEDLVTSGDYERALAEVKSVLFSPFVGPEAGLLHARILLELQSPDASVEQLYKLLNERSEIAANAHFLLARIYLESAARNPHMKDKAEVHLQHGEQLLPRTAQAYLLRAVVAQTVEGTVRWLEEALQLDPANYDAHRARALTCFARGEYHDMETEASVMIGSQPKNPVGYSLRAIARRELALTQNDGELLSKAVADHDRAIDLTPAHDSRLADLRNQRHRTLMRMGKYDEALADVQTCLELQPHDPAYRFDLFCVWLAMGRYEKAQAEYDNILKSGLMSPMHLNSLAAKYVSDNLWSIGSWHPQDKPPVGKAFETMREAARQYHQLAERARRVVPEGFHPSFSPDGAQLAYSRGVLGASGIEILHLGTGKTRLLTVPGKDPAWSPDGQYILYVRDRQFLSMQDLTLPDEEKPQSWEQEEVWIIRADGTERPRFLAKGGWPNWSGDSKRLYYHSRLDKMVCSMSTDPNNPNPKEVFACDTQFPVVSPDEKFIAFTEKRTGTLKIVDLADGSEAASWSGLGGNALSFISWSANGKRLAIGCYWQGGLWIYDMDTKEATKIVDGSFAWCAWSAPDMSRMVIERGFGSWHHEIWIADVVEDGVPMKGAQK